MSEDIIKAIVYTSLDETIGPNPLLWIPLDLSEKIRMGVSIKTITMLTTDQGIVPNSLVIMPFPAFKLKGIIKYIEREDDSRRGGIALSSMALLFNEADDLIFYKYMDYLEPVFSESAKKLIDLENRDAKSDEIFIEIDNFRLKLTEILDDLYQKEKSTSELEAFPEEELKKDLLESNFKIVVCGDPGVGKTSTVLRLTDNAFMRTYVPTLGVSISERLMEIGDKHVNLILWDIAGQSKFELMRRHFYKGTDAVILIFDLTNRKSFEGVSNWINDIKKYEKDLIGIIFGNKEDLLDERQILSEEALKIAETLNLDYVETSALTGKNIEQSFYKVAETLFKSK
ncbi:MAG: GTP-binding protein [Candidatus Lokiarchaeota archaeon]|nr:GTP-binding protein [Candidatus Lokiarchaeota archaeon]